MGMRWRAVVVKAGDEAVRAISIASQQLIVDFIHPVDVSILSQRPFQLGQVLTALQLVKFQNRTIECVPKPKWASSAFGLPLFQTGLGQEIQNQLSRDPCVGLAWSASRVHSDATYVVVSDTLCCSGYLHFRNGRPVFGSIYGWEGSEELWKISQDSVESKTISLEESEEYDYYSAAAEGLIQIAGPGADEIFLSGDDANFVWIRYRIMAEKQPVEVVTGVPEPA